MLFLGKLFLGENNANSTFIGIFTFPKTKDLGKKFIPKRFWEIFGSIFGKIMP
nr:MAG TPA: hypothetical protein [Caudoviricetes sp.]